MPRQELRRHEAVARIGQQPGQHHVMHHPFVGHAHVWSGAGHLVVPVGIPGPVGPDVDVHGIDRGGPGGHRETERRPLAMRQDQRHVHSVVERVLVRRVSRRVEVGDGVLVGEEVGLILERDPFPQPGGRPRRPVDRPVRWRAGPEDGREVGRHRRHVGRHPHGHIVAAVGGVAQFGPVSLVQLP